MEGGPGGEAGVELGREGGAEPSVGRAKARVGKALEAAVAAGWPAKAEGAVMPGEGSGAVDGGPGGEAC